MRRNQFAVRVLLLFLFLPVFAAAMPSGRGGHRPGEAPAVADSQQVFFTPEEEEALDRYERRNPGPTLAEIGAFEEGAERHEVAQSWQSYVFPVITKIVIIAAGGALAIGGLLWLGALLFSPRGARRQNRRVAPPADSVVIDPEPPEIGPAFSDRTLGGIDPRLAKALEFRGGVSSVPIPRPSRPFLPRRAHLAVIDGGRLGGAHKNRKPKDGKDGVNNG